MAQAVVSTKFQVVIPKDIRREVGLKSGQVVQVIAKGGVITMVPDQPIGRMKGYLKGMKVRSLRQKSDRE
jgi:AbrB family looped-hinge helix DNA binding protein